MILLILPLLTSLALCLKGNERQTSARLPSKAELMSGKSCRVCLGVIEDLEIYLKENILEDVVQSKLLKKCNKMKDGFGKMTCIYLVETKFKEMVNDMKLGRKMCKKLKCCSSKDI